MEKLDESSLAAVLYRQPMVNEHIHTTTGLPLNLPLIQKLGMAANIKTEKLSELQLHIKTTERRSGGTPFLGFKANYEVLQTLALNI